MAITQWSPNTQVSRGNVAVGIAPVITDMDAPTVVELNASLGLDCSITTFNGTSSSDSQAVDWLCNPASEQLPGSVTHTIDDLLIKTTGQADEDLYTALAIGDVVYIWRRDGLDHAADVEAGQRTWLWKATVTSVDPVEANNTFIGITAHITVLDRVEVPVEIIA